MDRRHGGSGASSTEANEPSELQDMVGYTRRPGWIGRVFGAGSGPIADRYSVPTQIAIGGVSGWCAGFVCQKVGKLAASAVGGGFLLLQIANHTGYVRVDWKRVERDMNKARQELAKKADFAASEVNSAMGEVQLFVKKNIVITGGFIGGFLLGLAS
uniref:FUN14 domain-containing protein 1 isoform X2 n=1 Tax=Myxine glutinosa TaxID=7769 RepID=UPI00358E5DAD